MDEDQKQKLVDNERLKLLATFLNGAAVAIFAVGGFAPIFSGMTALSGISRLTTLSSGVCFVGACGLHYLGSTILKGLRP